MTTSGLGRRYDDDHDGAAKEVELRSEILLAGGGSGRD